MSTWESAWRSSRFCTSSKCSTTITPAPSAARPTSTSSSVSAVYASGFSVDRKDSDRLDAATLSTRPSRSAIRFSRAAGSPAVPARSRSADATRLRGFVPVGIRSCGDTQSPTSEASAAIRRTSADLPDPASPSTVRPRSGMPASRRGRSTSRQSLNWTVRPAHTAGTESEPGLNGESRGVRT